MTIVETFRSVHLENSEFGRGYLSKPYRYHREYALQITLIYHEYLQIVECFKGYEIEPCYFTQNHSL